MADDQIHKRIEELVAEEQELYGRVGEGGMNANEHNRLESIRVSLDQCWDLLRQLAGGGLGEPRRARNCACGRGGDGCRDGAARPSRARSTALHA